MDKLLLRFVRTVGELSANCPLSDNSSPEKMERWKRAYNRLFALAAEAKKDA